MALLRGTEWNASLKHSQQSLLLFANQFTQFHAFSAHGTSCFAGRVEDCHFPRSGLGWRDS